VSLGLMGLLDSVEHSVSGVSDFNGVRLRVNIRDEP